ncbi:MAG: hypothetical protein JNK58_13625 [Phycisphaerae bacterium]|nr:hypothetical protein [Phycisphaerae bacterium]
MSLNVSPFRIDGSLRRLDSAGISAEQRLEDLLEQGITVGRLKQLWNIADGPSCLA